MSRFAVIVASFGKPLVVMAILRLSTKEHSPLTHPLGMYSLLHTTHSRQSWYKASGYRDGTGMQRQEGQPTLIPETQAGPQVPRLEPALLPTWELEMEDRGGFIGVLGEEPRAGLRQ